jgi:predicted nucleotidyltransferase
MKRDEIIEKLREREADLRAHGVTHAALFGSVARDEQ